MKSLAREVFPFSFENIQCAGINYVQETLKSLSIIELLPKSYDVLCDLGPYPFLDQETQPVRNLRF